MVTIERTYVLDTNVLIHDPNALYRFAEHNIFIPMTVLEELDAIKKGLSEVARNARQASRYLDAVIGTADGSAIAAGLALGNGAQQDGEKPSGRLYLQTQANTVQQSERLVTDNPDNTILATVLALSAETKSDDNAEHQIILVSKDINLRIKARVLGLQAEDYSSDRVLDDIDLLYAGTSALSAADWQRLTADGESWQQDGLDYYAIARDGLGALAVNELVYVEAHGTAPERQFVITEFRQQQVVLRQLHDHTSDDTSVWGIAARNREQNFAFNLLLDPAIDFVSMVGVAGTGKTLLALAAGLAQCLEQQRYKEIIVTRVTIPVGEDIGFLPGTEEEKMTPWMGALADNLEVLSESSEGGEWGRQASSDLLQQRIKIRSLNFMRGRTFLHRFVIVDEAQNLTPTQMKTLITRAGPGTKVVCLGNLGQIDTPYLSETTSGLTYVVDRFRAWPHSGHIRLQRGERSRLADYATERL